MALDHIGFGVRNFKASKDFYEKALAPLGLSAVARGDTWGFIGQGEKGEIWFGEFGNPATPIHIAFTAENRAQVDAFFAAALQAGGKDNGAPGIREHYHPNYYGAFVLDPDGHNIEAVCHKAE